MSSSTKTDKGTYIKYVGEGGGGGGGAVDFTNFSKKIS